MIVRQEVPDDQAAIFAVHTAAFARSYRRFGFQLAKPLGILPADPSWAEHFQVRPLTTWDGSLHGTFRYAQAFETCSPLPNPDEPFDD